MLVPRVKKIKWSLLYAAALLLCQGFAPAHGVKGVRTIVIDAGHGGRDPGCLGSTHREKEVALSVALRLGNYIENNLKDVQVVYTRTTDVFVDLEDRAQIANKAKADLFISIHCNAAGRPVMVKDARTGKMRAKMYKNKRGRWVKVEEPNPEPFGTETYVMGLKNEAGKMEVASRENSVILLEDDYEKKYGGFDPESEESYIIMSNYTSAYVIQSANLALKIQEEYVKKVGRVDKGVHRQSLWVLWRTSMPSVLTEIGFLTNPDEEKFLGSEKGQEYIAKAIFSGIRKYKDEMEGVKREYNDAFENMAPPGEEEKTEDSKVEKKEEPLTVEIKEEEKIELKESNGSAAGIAEKYKAAVTTGDLFFKVQFASSDVAIDLQNEKFSAITDADFYRHQGALKYTSGKFASVKDAQDHQKYLRAKGFADCFVIAMKNGQRIDMAEARKLLESRP